MSVHCREASLHVTPGLTQLKRLTSLTLLASCANSGRLAGISLDTGFSGMHSLQLLHIGCDQFKLDKQLLSMLHLAELKQVTFSSGIPIDEQSAVVYALLVHGLATRTKAHLRVASAFSVEELLMREIAYLENQSFIC